MQKKIIDINNLAPIVLFVYNRPWHARKTLEALTKNDLSNKSTLYIFADGPKKGASAEDITNIQATREVIKEKQWCHEVIISEKSHNKGLADSIVEGVTSIINKYGKIIVLEDDIITSPFFLTFMNNTLEQYKNEDKVMHIGGYWPKTSQNNKLPNTFFTRFMNCWGWATWEESWQYFSSDTDALIKQIDSNNLGAYFNLNNNYDLIGQLYANKDKKVHTWATKWYASIIINKGLCLNCKSSLVSNIGHDKSGTFCQNETTVYNVDLIESLGINNSIRINENKKALRSLIWFYKYGNNTNLKQRILKFIKLIYYYTIVPLKKTRN